MRPRTGSGNRRSHLRPGGWQLRGADPPREHGTLASRRHPVSENTFDEQRDRRKGDNDIDALNARIKILSEKSASHEKRVEALKFVVHFMGDIHEPLYCAERDKDKGGNGRLVFCPGQRKAVNLPR